PSPPAAPATTPTTSAHSAHRILTATIREHGAARTVSRGDRDQEVLPSARWSGSTHRGPRRIGQAAATKIARQAIAEEAVLAPPVPDRPNLFRCAAPGS